MNLGAICVTRCKKFKISNSLRLATSLNDDMTQHHAPIEPINNHFLVSEHQPNLKNAATREILLVCLKNNSCLLWLVSLIKDKDFIAGTQLYRL